MFKMLFWKFFIDDNSYWYFISISCFLSRFIFINGFYLIFLVRFPNCYWKHFGNLQSCSDSYPKIILLPLVSLIRHQYNILLGLTQQIGSGVNGQLLWNSAWQFCFCETLDPRSCSFCPEDQILKIFVALMRWQCPNPTSVTQDLIKM